jgi:hypothetical protein
MQISQRIGSAANPGGREDETANSAVSARSPPESSAAVFVASGPRRTY